jgi:hypothetical protein
MALVLPSRTPATKTGMAKGRGTNAKGSKATIKRKATGATQALPPVRRQSRVRKAANRFTPGVSTDDEDKTYVGPHTTRADAVDVPLGDVADGEPDGDETGDEQMNDAFFDSQVTYKEEPEATIEPANHIGTCVVKGLELLSIAHKAELINSSDFPLPVNYLMPFREEALDAMPAAPIKSAQGVPCDAQVRARAIAIASLFDGKADLVIYKVLSGATIQQAFYHAYVDDKLVPVVFSNGHTLEKERLIKLAHCNDSKAERQLPLDEWATAQSLPASVVARNSEPDLKHMLVGLQKSVDTSSRASRDMAQRFSKQFGALQDGQDEIAGVQVGMRQELLDFRKKQEASDKALADVKEELEAQKRGLGDNRNFAARGNARGRGMHRGGFPGSARGGLGSGGHRGGYGPPGRPQTGMEPQIAFGYSIDGDGFPTSISPLSRGSPAQFGRGYGPDAPAQGSAWSTGHLAGYGAFPPVNPYGGPPHAGPSSGTGHYW